MAKNYIPSQRGTTQTAFKIGAPGGIDLDASAASSPWTLTLPAGPGTSGYVLATNGSGATSWIAVGAASDSTTPYYIPVGELFVNNLNRQNLFNTPIIIDGDLEINGLLIEV